MLQLNPSIPVQVLRNGILFGAEAFMVIDYSKEDDLLFVCAMDDTGEVWSVPNRDIRFFKNYSIGRKLNA